MSKKYNGKIMFCSNFDLGIGQNGNHYVYVKKTKSRNKYDVHTITTIDSPISDSKHTIPLVIDRYGKKVYLDANKLRAIRNGNLYSIPYFQANFGRWCGITHKPIKGVHKSKLRETNKKIWYRHKFIVGKTMK